MLLGPMGSASRTATLANVGMLGTQGRSHASIEGSRSRSDPSQTMWKPAALRMPRLGRHSKLIEDSSEAVEMVALRMTHIQGNTRSQTLLLPACVDDYVGPDNVVRFIEAFVESLDLAVAGFDRALPKATGRPGYDPRDLLKLYICLLYTSPSPRDGLLSRMPSSA